MLARVGAASWRLLMNSYRILLHVQLKNSEHSGFFKVFGLAAASKRDAIQMIRKEILGQEGKNKIKAMKLQKSEKFKNSKNYNVAKIWYRSGKAQY